MCKVYNPGKACPTFTRWSDPERLTFCRGVTAFALEGTLVFRPLCPGWRNALSASEVNPGSIVLTHHSRGRAPRLGATRRVSYPQADRFSSSVVPCPSLGG